MAMDTSAPASPTGRTLSAALAEDRHREARRRAIRPSHSQSYSQLLLRLHRWGTACLPKSGAALARDLVAARRARTPTPPLLQPRSSAPLAGVSPRQDAAVVSVAERRPLRGREDAAVDQPTPAESQAEAVAVTEVAAGDRSTGSGEQATTLTTIGRGGSIWVRVLPKAVITPSLQLDSPQTSPAADDKYVWAEKYRPSVLKEFICNKDVAHELQLVTAHQCNHFIFEGPPAVGKRSMVLALIRDVFGPDDLKIEEHTKRFELKGEIAKHIDVRVKISGHHVE